MFVLFRDLLDCRFPESVRREDRESLHKTLAHQNRSIFEHAGHMASYCPKSSDYVHVFRVDLNLAIKVANIAKPFGWQSRKLASHFSS